MMLFVILLIVLIIGLVVFWSIRNGIGPMPSSSKVKNLILNQLPNEIGGTIIEAGSGWGTFAFPLAQKYPDNLVVGYENSPIPFLATKLVHFLFPLKNLRLIYGNFWDQSFAEAGLVVCYLYPEAMLRMKEKCEAELKAGTWLITNTFRVPGWEPVESYKVNDIYQTDVFLYQILKHAEYQHDKRK